MKKLDDMRKTMGVDAALITNELDVSWLTGFTGDSSQALVLADAAYFLTDFRYTEQANKQAGEFFTVIETAPQDRLKKTDELLRSHGAKSVGLRFTGVTLSDMEDYRAAIKAEFSDISDVLVKLRMIKDETEIEHMREGARITEAAFRRMLSIIKAGVSERELYSEMVFFFHKNGAEPSFTPIIASGENSSMPHAGVTDRLLKAGDFLTMDFGVKYKGVCTDFTRTVALFGVDGREKKIYNIVKCAQQAGLDALRPGMGCRKADAAARDIIVSAGYGEQYGHGTGHGVGAEIHEAPRLSPAAADIPLEAGMVVTVEPGIYIAGSMGVRIEDMAVITQDGYENFYTADKELIII